jgi:hypothetical protein
MSTNKDLLKQAIAEAKTIREAAIANAKEALEESLTPHLKEMLAQKLQEMENDEMEEEISEETLNGAETESYSENPRRHGNVLREEEDEEAPEEDEEEPTEEEGEEDIKIEDMSVEELKDLIRDIVAQETGAEDETGDDLGAEDMTGTEDGEEEIDINELLRELEEGSHEDKVEEYGSGYAEDPSDSAARGLENIISMVKSIKNSETLAKVKEFLKGLPAGAGAALAKEEIDEYGSTTMGDTGSSAAAGLDNIISMIKSLKSPEAVAKVKEFLKGLPAGASAAMRSEGADEELNEALKTVRVLRSQLQEVNLLNAKLLYVNKVFKANNLTEGQKVNVVAAFDKAETVKEVKLVFETVSKNVVAKQPARPAIKEHKSFASKPAGSTQKQVINEVSEAVNRMQILAGIKQREF